MTLKGLREHARCGRCQWSMPVPFPVIVRSCFVPAIISSFELVLDIAACQQAVCCRRKTSPRTSPFLKCGYTRSSEATVNFRVDKARRVMLSSR